MNKIFALTRIASFAMLLTASAFAVESVPAPSTSQNPTTVRRDRASRLERMHELKRLSAELELTREQQDQIRIIFKQRRDLMKALSESDRRGEKGALIRQEIRQQVRSILTPEQQVKFDAMKDTARERRKGQR